MNVTEIEIFNTLKTLIMGVNARAEETLRDTYAIELIDQKIREAEEGLRAAKGMLASLIQRQRSEERLLVTLDQRIADMTRRATEALDSGRDDLAIQAADALAQMENERVLRAETVLRLETKTVRLRQSVEAGHRRIIDLKQGATTARAIRRELSHDGLADRMADASFGPATRVTAADVLARLKSKAA